MTIISGNDQDNSLFGLLASEQIYGLGGNDSLYDNQGGDDSLFGGEGNDLLQVGRLFTGYSGYSNILLDGGAGNDRLELKSGGSTTRIMVTATGGTGDDLFLFEGFIKAVIDAGEGDDLINLTVSSSETLVMTLGSGRDRVKLGAFYEQDVTTNAWRITDFAAGNSGDSLDLSAWLQPKLLGWDAYNPFGGGYLRLLQSGADTLVQIDVDAAGGPAGWSTVITLNNVTATALTAANFAGYGPDGSPAVGIVINGTTGGDYLLGTVGGDTIFGNGGSDSLSGGAGNDIIYIGAEGSWAYGDSQDDTIQGGAGDDVLFGGEGNDSISGGGGNDLFQENGIGNDLLNGDDGDDVFNLYGTDTAALFVANGGNGNDRFDVGITNTGLVTLNGGAGDDRFRLGASTGAYLLSFGSGNDRLVIDASIDGTRQTEWNGLPFIPQVTITDIAAADRVDFNDVLELGLTGWDGVTNPLTTGHMRLLQDGASVRLQIDRDGGANGFVDFITYQNRTIANLTALNLGGFPANGGTPPGQSLTGTDGNDRLIGSSGADTITLLGGFDYAEGGAGNDIIDDADGMSEMWGGAGNDELTAGGDGGLMYGGAGDDVLTNTGVYATLYGGSGNDRLDASGTTDSAYLTGGTGYDTVIGGVGDDDITIDDADYVDGGDGSDIAHIGFQTSLVGVTIDLRAMWSGGVGIIGGGQIRNVERVQLVMGSNSADIINVAGYTGDMAIRANDGDDYVEGGSGADQLLGEGGNDQLIGNDGDDYLEGLSGNDILNGGDGADGLDGGAGADVLIGGAGSDTLGALAPGGETGGDLLYGGSGDDGYYVDGTDDIVFEFANEGVDFVVSYVGYYLWDNIEDLILADFDDGRDINIFGVGNAGDNAIYGNAGSNLLIAGAGNDELNGGIGNDQLFGEAGDDFLFGSTGIDYLVGGAGNDELYGGDQADALYGGDGDDWLEAGDGFVTDILVGGDGNDVLMGRPAAFPSGDYDLMDGGAGNDAYYVDTPDDLTFEAAGGGTDTVYAAIIGAGYYLYPHTENLVLQGSTPFGVGNDLDNLLVGNSENNYLLGGLGNDILDGNDGNDVLFGEGGADTFRIERGTGGDVIGDFQPGIDKIRLVGIGIGSFSQLQTAFVENAGTTAINLGQGDFIVLNGISNAQLTAADFLFG